MNEIKIKRLKGTITKVIELSPTAREYVLTLSEPMPFKAGAFVNFFFSNEGSTIRRAFSISSTDTEHNIISLSIRLSPKGLLTPILWEKDYTGLEVDIMGPMGLNTSDKMKSDTVYLCGFGIGAGVVKSLADDIARRDTLKSLTIMTGNRGTDELLHKDYFDALAASNPKVKVVYVVSQADPEGVYPVGYIQNHVSDYDFTNSDVYTCGQTIACTALVEAVKQQPSEGCAFFVEDFH
jgi:phenol hydroxylase P5 protein